jgi:rhamnose transport system permease protein
MPRPLGRSLYAIGLNKDTAFFSGIRVKRIKLLLYTLSGVICAGAGILWTFQYASSRYDAGTGLELDVVTVVLFGVFRYSGAKAPSSG